MLKDSPRHCAQCGAVLSGYALEGACGNCLLKPGLEPVPEPLDEPGDETHSSALRADSDRSNHIEAVGRLGDYELLEEISRGGMGIVYRARQVSLDRIVAVKMLLAGPLATKDFVRRFRTESAAAASLQHPNIVAIHEVGFAQGQHFFAMDYIEGLTLGQLVARGPLPAREAATYLKTIAEAIHFAHERNVLHRDLKPSNVLIDSATNQPRVTDFGLAKRLEDETELTFSGQMLGSPNYMSPEQATAKRGTVGRRSDVYSLGAILYHLLTGRPPFQGQTLTDVLRQLADDDPLAPRLLTSRLPHDLETICLKCLEKEPPRRYQTAQELADELSRFLRDEPIEARSLTRFEHAWRWCRRNPKPAILSAAVILLLITVAIGSTLAAFRINRAERAATEELFRSYLVQAGALRRSGQEGQRFGSLEAVVKAAAIRSSVELRSEAIACLAVTDVRFRNAFEPPNPENESWDASLERRAYVERDGRISVRRVADNGEVALLPSLIAGTRWVGPMSPDGRYLFVQYEDKRHMVWDIEKQQPIITNLFGALAWDFSADARSIMTSAKDGQLRLFGLNPPFALTNIAIAQPYTLLRIRPQGDWFAGCELEKGDVEVRRLCDGSLLRTFSQSSRVGGLASRVGSLGWSSDGMDLAVGCESGRIFIWNALTGETRHEFKAHKDKVASVGFSHSGRLLASSSWDGDFRLWDLAADCLLLTAKGYSYQTDFSTDDSRIGYVQRGRQTGMLEITPSPIFHRLCCQASPNRGSYSMDVSPDGRLISAAYLEGVHLWADQQREAPFFLAAGVCNSALFTPDGTNLITCGDSGLARWPLRYVSGATTDELHIGPRQTIRDGLKFNYAALSLDGRWVAAAYPEAEAVSVYEVRDPTNQFDLVFQPRVTTPAISADGRWVAAGNFKTSGVKVWEFESQRVVYSLPTPSSAWVAFSPDNRWLAIGREKVELRETGSWRLRHTIQRVQPSEPTPMAFSPDSRMLAVAVGPGIVRLVATDNGEALANLEAPGAALITYLRFSADGSQLFVLDWDQQLQVWDLRRIRAELRKLNLDWSTLPIPAEPASPSPRVRPLRIVAD